MLVMTACLQCKYDFCWVCLEAWKKHSTATGGYFRCNRYEVVKKVEDSHDQMKTEVIVRSCFQMHPHMSGPKTGLFRNF